MTKSVTLDSFDRRLLELVRRNNLEPARSLAEKVGLSESAVLRRLRRLRKERVIVADVAIVDPARLNAGLTMHVLVEMEREGSALYNAFAAGVAARKEVLSAWHVTGSTDFLLTVTVPTMEAYETFTHEVLNDDRRVRSFTTLVGIREVVRRDPSRSPLSDKE